MAKLVVYLVNDASLPDGVRATIRDRLTEHLNTTLSRAGKLGVGTGGIDAVDIRWVSDCPQRTRRDVVVRFRRPPRGGDGFVCSATDDGGWEFASRGHTAITGHGTRSVVYVPRCRGGASPQGNILGNIAFHELMHNKVSMGDEMHDEPDLQLGSGGDVGPTLAPSDGDVRLLAPHLGDQHTQLCP